MANILGTTGNDTLFGDTDPLNPNDVLNSSWLAGDDQMIGGNGNDTYNINSALDTVLEGASQGTDTVVSQLTSYTLGNNVENLVLQQTDLSGTIGPFGVPVILISAGPPTAMNGYGNALANTLTGNTNGNILSGMAGADTISGGDGGDAIYGGTENDTLNGDGGNDYLDGGANDDTLNGGQGADTLYGGSGNDSLAGGIGDDSYTIDALGDVVTEAAGAGTDTVSSSISDTLDANVENLTLTGTALNGTGNGLNNVIVGSTAGNTLTGNGGDDTLRGGLGSDTLLGSQGNDQLEGQAGIDFLTGGVGQDRFVFSSRLTGDVDTITDFNAADDTIVLADALDVGLPGATSPGITGLVFTGGTLSSAWYFEGIGMNGSGTGLSGIYVETNSGAIYYDPTSGVAGDAVKIGQVDFSIAATLSNADFVLG